MDPRPSLIRTGDRIINVDHIVYATFTDHEEARLTVTFSVQHEGEPQLLAFQGDEARKLWLELQNRTTRQ